MSDTIKIEVDKFLQDIVPKFVESRKQDIQTLKDLHSKNKFSEIESLAHKIKGNAGSYGLYDLGKWGGELEHSCQVGEHDGIGELIEKMGNYLNRLEITFVDIEEEDDDDDDF